MKELRWVTRGIFYCRDSAGFSIFASNKLLCNLTDLCFEIGNKNIPPSVTHHNKKRDSDNEQKQNNEN